MNGMALSSSAQKVQDRLASFGLSYEVVELPQSTRTAADAARAVGCGVAQIAKSIVFERAQTHAPVLVIASGANRINEKTIEELISEPITKASADFVRERTGFAIGGVPPVGHAEPFTILIDEDLLKYPEIWAAAGTPNSVFKLAPDTLPSMTGGRIVCIK